MDDRAEHQAVEGGRQVLGRLRARQVAARLAAQVQLAQQVDGDAPLRLRLAAFVEAEEIFAISRKIAR